MENKNWVLQTADGDYLSYDFKNWTPWDAKFVTSIEDATQVTDEYKIREGVKIINDLETHLNLSGFTWVEVDEDVADPSGPWYLTTDDGRYIKATFSDLSIQDAEIVDNYQDAVAVSTGFVKTSGGHAIAAIQKLYPTLNLKWDLQTGVVLSLVHDRAWVISFTDSENNKFYIKASPDNTGRFVGYTNDRKHALRVSTMKKDVNPSFATKIREQLGIEYELEWELYVPRVDIEKVGSKNSDLNSIWVVTVTESSTVFNSGLEEKHSEILGRDVIAEPAIFVELLQEAPDGIMFVNIVNGFLKSQNSPEEMFDDDAVRVIRESDDLKIYKVDLEPEEDDNEETLEIYIQAVRKTLA